jgi:hypothetical protein
MRIKYTFLFLLIILVGCQSFVPERGDGAGAAGKRGVFLESVKRLFLPDFDDPESSNNLKVADNKNNKNNDNSKHVSSQPPPNYAYGNSLSAFPQQNGFYPNQNPDPNQNSNPTTFPPSYLYDTSIAPPQNNLVCSSCFEIPEAEHASVALRSGCSGAKPTAHTGFGITNNLPTTTDSPQPQPADPQPKTSHVALQDKKTVDGDANGLSAAVVRGRDLSSELVSESLLPKRGDSERFRLFLKELAGVPAGMLKVSEAELVERVVAFRAESLAVSSPAFEALAIKNLRADILPDFLADKKLDDKSIEGNEAHESESVLTATNQRSKFKAAWKPKFEQVAYYEQRQIDSDDIYRNDNSDINSKNKIDTENKPLPDKMYSSNGRKRQLSAIQPRGVETEKSRESSDSGNAGNVINPPNSLTASKQSLPSLPQLNHDQPNTNSSIDTQKTQDKKFVNQPLDSHANIVPANYTLPNAIPNTTPTPNANLQPQPQLSNIQNDWESHARQAIAILQHDMETTSALRTFSNDVKLRLLELSVGNRGEAVKPLATAEKQINEFWTNQMLGLATIMDEMIIPNRVTRYDSALARFEGGIAALRQVCPLRLRNVQLVQSDEKHHISFGNFQIHEEDCRAGENISIYLELENPTVKNLTQGYNVKVSVAYEIIDTTANVVQARNMGTVEDVSSVPKRDHFIKMAIDLKRNLPQGNYNLRIHVTDLNNQDPPQTVEEQIPIRITR